MGGRVLASHFITAFDTQLHGFNLNLHHSTMVKYDGPVGQSFSHSFNMMIVQDDELTGQIVTPDLRIYDIYSEDGLNWYLPEGFYARLCIDHELNRWILTHYSGLEIAFYLATIGCPGYPISISEPNGNTACMTYDSSGYLQDITTDLGQIQVLDEAQQFRLQGKRQVTDFIYLC
jgi:YD repeat-containing protein